VQAMAAVVHANACEIEDSGVAAGRLALFQHHYEAQFYSGGMKDRDYTSGSRAQDR
jgi:hypothetical protein